MTDTQDTQTQSDASSEESSVTTPQTAREAYADDVLEGATVEDPDYGRGTVRESKEDARALVDFEEKNNPLELPVSSLKLVEVGE